MGSWNKSDVVALQQLFVFRFGWVQRQGAEPTVAFETALLNYSKRIWYMHVCHITLAAAELLCLRTFAFGNIWSKAFRKWLWHVLQHWDSGRTPCTTTGSVARHNPSWDVRSGNSSKERGEWKGGGRRRGGGVAGLSPSPSFFRLWVAIFHLARASLMLWSGCETLDICFRSRGPGTRHRPVESTALGQLHQARKVTWSLWGAWSRNICFYSLGMRKINHIDHLLFISSIVSYTDEQTRHRDNSQFTHPDTLIPLSTCEKKTKKTAR